MPGGCSPRPARSRSSTTTSRAAATSTRPSSTGLGCCASSSGRSCRTEEELSRLAWYDDLTGLANRRAFVTVGEQLLRLAHRAGETVLVVYADLDGMKAINDCHGHAAGDEALRRAAGLLRDTFREADLVARIGGDEFCVLLPSRAGEAKIGRAH